jgi:aquaporin Z
MQLAGGKIVAEIIGTAALVFMGCAAAITNGFGIGFVGIALTFGLVIVAMAYSIGNVSGCHVNPAVSLGLWVSRRISGSELISYVVSQVIGAFMGGGLLLAIFGRSGGLGQNSFGQGHGIGLNAGRAFLVEVILTFIFVIAVIGVTSKVKNGAVAGVVIGLTLTLVHLVGLPLTGTSVNPARSLSPAVLMGGEALAQVWVFLIAPLLGAALAALAYRGMTGGTPAEVAPAVEEAQGH